MNVRDNSRDIFSLDLLLHGKIGVLLTTDEPAYNRYIFLCYAELDQEKEY